MSSKIIPVFWKDFAQRYFEKRGWLIMLSSGLELFRLNTLYEKIDVGWKDTSLFAASPYGGPIGEHM